MSTASLIEKYNIKSRLIELVILFIAVSLRFVVENYREDYSEKQNAKELLSSMLTDLQEDIIRFETFSDARKKLINDVYSFIDDVENRGLLKDDLIQQKLFSMTIFNWTYFEPNTANIEQVISSGALRYLGNDELIHQIGVLESQNLSTMNRQKREQEFFLNYLQPLMHKHYNFKWINSNFVRNWESFYHANEKLAKVNPSSKDLMFWVDNTELKKTIINLFENYVFILRASYGVNYDEYLHEINDTIQIIELHLETE